ncbi:RHS repeat domain-containing protein [Ekhidna sp.]|uniref:RHS repeat domain-containing protein n=1 Tax=Ekhidna sp. TaxID=2608089 RepID=UPI003CCBE594
MKVRYIALLVVIFLKLEAFAQELPEVLPPSPTVGNLMTFEEVPIDYHTGQPNITIPLLSKQAHPDLTMNAVLRYSTQGVKVDAHSGWVGTGWSLSAGGVVSRTIRGLPDHYNFSDKKGVLHIPNFWNYDNLTQDEKDEYRWNVLGTSAIRLDSELDLYQFSVNGMSGRFVVILEGNELKAKMISSVSNIKINLDYDPVTRKINAFELIDTKGLKYQFSQKESTFSKFFTATMTQIGTPKLVFSGSSGSFGGGETIIHRNEKGEVIENSEIYIPGGINWEGVSMDDGGFDYNFSEDEYTATSAWHLTSIQTYNDQTLVDLSYVTDNVSYEVSKSFTESRILNVFGASRENVLGNLYNRGLLEPLKKVSFHQVQISTAKLDSVKFKDGVSWVLSIDTETTHPETNGKILHTIEEREAGNPVRKFELETDEVADRLWLTGIIDTDLKTNEERRYDLSYNDRANLNSYGQFRDIWGYNNAPINPQYDPETPVPFDETLITKGLLSSITYPTGGSQHYEFEHHSFSHAEGKEIQYEDYIESPQNFTYRSNNMNLSGSYDLTASSGFIASEVIHLTHNQSVLIKIPQLQADQDLIDNMRIVILDSDGNQENQAGIDTERGTSLDLTSGTKTIRLEALNADTYTIEGTIRTYYKELNASLDQFILGGGVRIKSIEFKEGLGLLRKFNYSYNEIGNSLKSSGAIDAILGNLRLEYNHTITKSLFNHPTNYAQFFKPIDIQYAVATQNGVNAAISKGEYVTYRNVKVEETGNGYTVYHYTNAEDYPLPLASFELPISAPSPDIDFQRGLLVKQEVFDANDHILKSDSIAYSFKLDTVGISYKIADLKTSPYKQFYDSYENNENGFPARNVPKGPYGEDLYPQPFNAPPLPTVDEIYVAGEEHTIGWAKQVKKISKEFTYDVHENQHVMIRKETFQYNNENHQPRSIKIHLAEGGDSVFYETTNYYPVGSVPANYTALNGLNALASINRVNDIVYTKQQKLVGSNEVALPISTSMNVYSSLANNVVGLMETHSAVGAEDLEKRLEIHAYDQYGNILEVSKYGSTGSDMHIVYLWGYNHSVPVVKINDVTLSEIDQTIRNNIGTANESTLVSYVNSLRTSFPDKQVTSFIYDEGLRLIEVKDVNEFKTSYEYDGMGRLLRIKDNDDNIIKEVTYNTKN